MLPLDPEEDIAVIGPLADVWYKDWYSGIPPYFVTPLDGIRSQSNVAFERAALQAHIGMADGSYLGVDNGGVVCRADFEHAALFELECWDDEQVTIRFVENGKLLTVEDDFAKGQEGLVTASKDEPFGWFVKEIFHLTNVQTAEAAITEQHGICADVSISAWNGAALCFDELGRLSVAKREDQVLDDRIGVAGTTDQHSVEQTAGLPIVIERVRSGLQEAKKLAACSGKVVLVLGANPMINGKEEIDRKDLNLPPYQSRLLKEITDVNPNVVLVLISSVPFALDWAAKNVPAILISATGSMEIGNALADILFGQESPAGRLPMTWYSEKAELPDMDDYDIFLTTERNHYYDAGLAFYVDPFPGQQDYLNLKLAIDGFQSIEDITSIFYKDLYSIGDGKKREKIVENMCQKSSEYFELDGAEFKDAVFQRENMRSTYWGNGIAVPHPLTAVSSDSFVAVTELPQAVVWDDQKNMVNLVLLVCVGKNSSKAFQLWNYLAKVFSDKHFVERLLPDPSYEHFIALLKEAIAGSFQK